MISERSEKDSLGRASFASCPCRVTRKVGRRQAKYRLERISEASADKRDQGHTGLQLFSLMPSGMAVNRHMVQ
jgi:hypothetical protein